MAGAVLKSDSPPNSPHRGGLRLLLRRRRVGVGLLPLFARLADHLGQAPGVAGRANRRAAVDSGRADRFEDPRLSRPGFSFLARAAWPQLLGDAVAFGLGSARADDDLVVGRARARVVTVNNDFGDVALLGHG